MRARCTCHVALSSWLARAMAVRDRTAVYGSGAFSEGPEPPDIFPGREQAAEEPLLSYPHLAGGCLTKRGRWRLF